MGIGLNAGLFRARLPDRPGWLASSVYSSDSLADLDPLRSAALVKFPIAWKVRISPTRSRAASCLAPPSAPTHMDLLIDLRDREEVADRLLDADAYPDGLEQAPDSAERRERWRAGRGHLTVRWKATGIDDVAALRDRAHRVYLNQDDAGLVRVALVEDLAKLVAHSPWSEDALYRAGLRAVLASGRYSSRKPRDERLELA